MSLIALIEIGLQQQLQQQWPRLQSVSPQVAFKQVVVQQSIRTAMFIWFVALLCVAECVFGCIQGENL